MNSKSSSNEFEAVISDDGTISIPAELQARYAGKKLHIRLHREEDSLHLRSKNVTEDEVESIANLQLESREQVVTFLLSEGVLNKNKGFLDRVLGELHR